MNSLTLPAPAKINLFLHILSRRSDGYHNIQTAMQFLDYADELTFTVNESQQINLLTELPGISPSNNLILRAANLLQQATQCKQGVTIQICKKIPIGGGLGGGSSDAATTLLALNQLWQTALSVEELIFLGTKLGADIPFFINGQSAWAEGIGEQLTPVQLPECWLAIIFPGCQIPTVEIYSAPELTRNTPAITISEFFAQGGHNDCEAIVKTHYPETARAIDWLMQHASTKMTGSGSCVFASFKNQDDAHFVVQQIPPSWSGFVAKGLNESPTKIELMRIKDLLNS